MRIIHEQIQEAKHIICSFVTVEKDSCNPLPVVFIMIE